MGCQKDIADTIINKGADYLLALKTNQELLHRAVVSAFREAKLTSDAQIEKGHGRIEAREYYVLDAKDIASAFPQWKGLRTIGMAINYINDGETESVHYRYYISSAKLTQEQFGKAVRGHWGIESKLHWVLDTAMKEDNCQIYRDNGAENLARLRHIARNIIRADKSRKASVRRKQRMAAMDPGYLENIFLNGLEQFD